MTSSIEQISAMVNNLNTSQRNWSHKGEQILDAAKKIEEAARAQEQTLRQRGSDVVIIDEGSTNGTALDSVLLAPQSPRVLRSGDLVRVGRVWLEIRIDPLLMANANPTSAKALALGLITQALATQGEDNSTWREAKCACKTEIPRVDTLYTQGANRCAQALSDGVIVWQYESRPRLRRRPIFTKGPR